MTEPTPLREFRCPGCKTWGPEIRFDPRSDRVRCVECGAPLPRDYRDSLPTRPARLADRIAAYTDHLAAGADPAPPWDPPTLDDGEWHHLEFSWTGTEAALYIDHVCINTAESLHQDERDAGGDEDEDREVP